MNSVRLTHDQYREVRNSEIYSVHLSNNKIVHGYFGFPLVPTDYGAVIFSFCYHCHTFMPRTDTYGNCAHCSAPPSGIPPSSTSPHDIMETVFK